MNIKLYCEDNLKCLKSLENNSINLIYSDIMFGTGRRFNGFVDLKPIRSEIEKHYVPRFQEMHRVLKETGTIYVHMDWHISHWVRCMLDDIFGYTQFKNEIIWQYNSAPRKKGSFGNRHDTIFRYTKTNNFVFNEDTVREPYSLSAPRGYQKERYYHPLGKVLGDCWVDIPMISQRDKVRVYDTQKPLALVERIIKVSSNENDLCADFYLGSGNAALAALMLNRRFIGCDNSELAIEISKKRLAKWL